MGLSTNALGARIKELEDQIQRLKEERSRGAQLWIQCHLTQVGKAIALIEQAPSVKAPRFVLRSVHEMSPEDRERLGVNHYGYGQLLEDTFTGEYWTDGGEPEDASFYRDYAWVPAKLNELAAESARSVEVLLEVVKMLQELLLAVEQQTRAPE